MGDKKPGKGKKSKSDKGSSGGGRDKCIYRWSLCRQW